MSKFTGLSLLFIGCMMALSSCSTPKDIVYFQDLDAETILQIEQNKGVIAKTNDELSIVVSSPNPELSALFNLPLVTTLAGRSGQSAAYNQQIATYTVNSKGDIDFPILGTVHVGGLTREEISEKIKNELLANNLISDPVVSVSFVNVFYSVSGEVTRPGRYGMDRDRMTVVDAITKAGDLTIYGNRIGVKVIRREEGTLKTYTLDLTDAKQVTQSPAYFIQQDDVIYVTPNDTRKRQATVNSNSFQSVSFWVSIASVITSLLVLAFK